MKRIFYLLLSAIVLGAPYSYGQINIESEAAAEDFVHTSSFLEIVSREKKKELVKEYAVFKNPNDVILVFEINHKDYFNPEILEFSKDLGLNPYHIFDKNFTNLSDSQSKEVSQSYGLNPDKRTNFKRFKINDDSSSTKYSDLRKSLVRVIWKCTKPNEHKNAHAGYETTALIEKYNCEEFKAVYH